MEGVIVATAEQGVAGEVREMLPRGPEQALPIHLLARLIDWALVVAAAIMIALVFFNVCAHVLGTDLAQLISRFRI